MDLARKLYESQGKTDFEGYRFKLCCNGFSSEAINFQKYFPRNNQVSNLVVMDLARKRDGKNEVSDILFEFQTLL